MNKSRWNERPFFSILLIANGLPKFSFVFGNETYFAPEKSILRGFRLQIVNLSMEAPLCPSPHQPPLNIPGSGGEVRADLDHLAFVGGEG